MPLSIMVVGAWQWPWYHEACCKALEHLGHTVLRFSWFKDFYRRAGDGVTPVYKSISLRIQNRLLWGPALLRINARLVREALKHRPDVVWFYSCTHIFPRTVRRLRRLLPECALVQYTNDCPFAKGVWPDYWRHYRRAIPWHDIHFVYRKSDENRMLKAGASDVRLLRSYYIPETDFPEEREVSARSRAGDVVFVGHYESDGRLACIRAIVEAGHDTAVYGNGWQRAVRYLRPDDPVLSLYPIRRVLGDEYRRMICGAKIALCFLSKLNMDGYTRRNFEIPAMKTFMLSEHSEELESLFIEGVEAEYFRSSAELLEKVEFYLSNDRARESIAAKGYERVRRDGHDVINRMKEFSEVVALSRQKIALQSES